MLKYHIHSMVGKVEVGISNINSKTLQFFPLKNRTLIFRVPNSTAKITVLGFGNGNKTAMIYGGVNAKELTASFKKMIKEFGKIGIDVKQCSNIETVNIAVSGKFGITLNLEKISAKFAGSNIEYNPEQFPAMIFKMKNPKCVFLLFSTGSFIIQGLKNTTLVSEAINEMRSLLRLM